MTSLVTAHDVEVRESEIHGWGVFAKTDIHEGIVVEESPLTRTTIHSENDRHTFLNNYFWSDEEDNYILSLGLASVFNRSNTPNLIFEAFLDEGFYRFTACRDLWEGEELFIDYTKRILRS
jgi:SET domain-containing protein